MTKSIISYAFILVLLFVGSLLPTNCFAQEDDQEAEAVEPDTAYEYDPKYSGTYDIGKIGKITVPPNHLFLDSKDAKQYLMSLDNPPSDDILGLVLAVNPDSTMRNIFYVIWYVNDGHIDDSDAKNMDFTELLEQMQTDLHEGNRMRLDGGYKPIKLLGWASPPFYDDKKHVLHWAKELRFGQDTISTINYNFVVLTREGKVKITAVCDKTTLAEVKTAGEDLLDKFEVVSGSRYIDYDSSIDKLAAYGIGGLIAGKVLSKAGFFSIIGAFFLKYIKVIILGLGGLGAYLINLFRKKKVVQRTTAVATASSPEANEPEPTEPAAE